MKRRSFLRGLLGIAGLSAAGGIGSVQKPVIGFDPAKPGSEKSFNLTFERGDDGLLTGVNATEYFGRGIAGHPRVLYSQKQLNAFYRKRVDNAKS